MIALDVETILDTHALCLIQLGTPECIVIVDPLALPTLEPLRSVLESD